MTNIETILNYRPAKRKRNYGTTKKGTPCPHCGSFSFDFHVGRWKTCRSCGYSNFMENQISTIKWLARRDRLNEVSQARLNTAYEYIERIGDARARD